MAHTLATFWARDRDQVLGHVFTPGGLLVDPAPLLTAGADAAEQLLTRADTSWHAFLGHAVLQHHTAKATGATITDEPPHGARQAAFLRRSTAIGLLIAHDDHDLASRHASEVTSSTLAARIEHWAMVTYNGDARPGPDWWVPQGVTLTRTADQVLREIATYPGAYIAYLVEGWLPRALARDPRFAGRARELATALRQRRDDIDRHTTARDLDRLVGTIERTP